MSAIRAGLAAFWGRLEPVTEGIWRASPRGERGWHSWLAELDRKMALVTYSAGDEEWPAAVLAELAAAPAAVEPYGAVELSAPLDGAAAGLVGVVLLAPWFEPRETWGEPGAGLLLWAVPITRSELEYAVLAGGRALEAALFEADVRPYSERNRRGVV